VILSELGRENILRLRRFGSDLDQANLRPLQPLPALHDIEGDAFTFIEGREPGSFKSRDVDEHVLPSLSRVIKPKPFLALNHFTVPVCPTAGPEDSSFDVVAPELDRGGVLGLAVLVSLSTSVTCGPVCPGPMRTSRVSPGWTALMPL
jgi:hypothetical protein